MKNKERMTVVVWSVLILLLLSFYVGIYCRLDYGLQTIFDEGFFFLHFKSDDVYTVQTRSLSLAGELLKSLFPRIGEWDVLALRRVSFGMKGASIILFCLCSSLYVYRERQERKWSSFLTLVACVLLFGLFVMPSVVINGNDLFLVVEMFVVSLCFIVVSTDRMWAKGICTSAIGTLAFMAMLCNAPGGAMLLLLAFMFMLLYKGYNKRKLGILLLWLVLGLVMGLVVMKFAIISFRDALEFVRAAFAQTTNGTGASHHSLTILAVLLLLNTRDLVMTLTMLCGITFLCELLQRHVGKKWLTIVIGLVLFVIMYKWQVKPKVTFAGIMTWIVLMTWMVHRKSKKEEGYWSDDLILVLFLYLIPMAISIGSNVGFLNKVTTFIVPWGFLLFVLSRLTNNVDKLFSDGLLIFVFVFVLYGRVIGLLHKDVSNTTVFTKEYPIARMHLNEDQFAFYDEVYSILESYGYKSKQDTLLGFCYNEMTIVAIDAVPYSNDQLPEEFLLHDKDKLVQPKFMILSEWDIKVLTPMMESLNWKFPEAYDCYRLVNNPDPNSIYDMTQSTLYCLKDRKAFFGGITQ